MGITLGYLTSLYGTANSSMGSGSLLATLYGHAGQSPTSLGQNPVTALKSAEQRQTQDIKAIAAQPAVNRAVNAFIAAVNSAKTVQQLLANPTVMQGTIDRQWSSGSGSLRSAGTEDAAIRRERPEIVGQ